MASEILPFDVVIVGAGPAGLCFARALRDAPLRVGLVERQDAATLEAPAYDGREIALTQRSARLLRELGIWSRLPTADLAPLKSARVLNGLDTKGLDVAPPRDTPELGYLISNHHIRTAAYAEVRDQPNVTLLAGATVRSVTTESGRGQVVLGDGRVLEARLVVAADTRFSETRRAIGIPARHRDFGKTMLVCKMAHEVPHEGIATEWFGHEQTLAVLPLNQNRASIVVTLRHVEIEALRKLPVAEFEREMERRFLSRLGKMTLETDRYAYPLVGVYPERFTSTRYAAVGDAAVGMHPVTAHGFNLGLIGTDALARLVIEAARSGADIGAPALLARYDREHRVATLPLYLATNAIVGLYTANSPPARFLRQALLGVARSVAPVSAALSGLLMQGALPNGSPRDVIGRLLPARGPSASRPASPGT
jgi:ubiquinone biosynthesis UbiH/UbiF/VisC/COQ6 family hydroxylase